MTLEATGTGLPDRRWSPSLLRIMVGAVGGRWETKRLILLETNVDDMNPSLGHLMHRLFTGVLDVSMIRCR